jgi:predicted TIM-barrel fold metal-dependent hydrolase
MAKLQFFDCNLIVGRRSSPRPENNLSIVEILGELDYAQIDKALTTHASARDLDPRIGNAAMTELANQHDRFVTSYVVLPHHTGEFPCGDALLRYLSDGGAKAVRMFPVEHSFGLGETWCGNLFATLAEAGVPVFIDQDQTDWVQIDGVLEQHPQLDLVVLRVGYRINRWVYPLLEKHKGLHLEPAFYAAHRGIETLTRKFGPNRMVFGTGLPEWDAAAPISAVQYADIDDECRRQIAGENLSKLLWNNY